MLVELNLSCHLNVVRALCELHHKLHDMFLAYLKSVTLSNYIFEYKSRKRGLLRMLKQMLIFKINGSEVFKM